MMRLQWNIQPDTLERWQDFVDENIKNDFVVERKKKNIKRRNVDLSEERIWHVLVGCQVTTQQRSSPGSKVSKFLSSNTSPALDYECCRSSRNRIAFLKTQLKRAELWRFNVIANNLATTLSHLEADGMDELMEWLDTIRKNTTKKKERKIAAFLAESKMYPGLGPKQSRNFIQWLGLSRYEIPIDSRVTKVMKRMGCTFVPSGSALSDALVYVLMQDVLQEISSKLGIYPCMLDACIFSSFDVKGR